MTFNLKTKVRSGYFLAFLLLLVSYFLIFFVVQQLDKGTKVVAHTYKVINKLQSLKGVITDAETGVRGFVITKEERFLEPYNIAMKDIPGISAELKTLIHDNQQQQILLDTLNFFIDKKLGYLEQGIRKFRDAGFVITGDLSINRESSKNAMDSIRLFIGRMIAGEERLMEQRSHSLSNIFSTTNIVAITSLVVALITVLYSVIVYNRENKAKEGADKKAILYHEQLENKLRELEQVNGELHDLKQIEKFAATGRIARTIAHEVRNPLTNISLATEQLSETVTANDEASLLLGMIRRNAGRIDQLVSDLLDSTRFAQLDFVKINASQLLDETLELARDRIELKNVGLNKKYTNNGCEVFVDVEKIKLGLLNIIVNAIEAMEKGKGILTLDIYKSQDKCVIGIHDNGCGMDDDTLQKIYEPYYTGKTNGSGLGLTNTQNIILNHRGNITVKSKPGQGTSFLVALQTS